VITKFSPFLKQKYLVFITFLFFLTRVPLLKNHFFHCDDSAGLLTYPLLSKFIGYLSWYAGEVMHYKLFPNTPSFIFENMISRSFSLFMGFCSLWVLLIIINKLFKNDYLTLFMGVIICCSQMSMIYSIHSGPYGYSTLSIGLMIIYMLNMEDYNRQLKRFYLLLFCIIICPFFDVFSIFIIPVFVIIVFVEFDGGIIKFKINKRNLVVSFGLLISSLFVIFFQIIPLTKVMHRPLAVHWNKGLDSQFILSNTSLFSFILNPLETIWFYIKNIMLIFENNLSPINCFNNHLENTVTIITTLLALPVIIIGVIKLKKINFKLYLFFSFSIVFFFCFIYLKFLVLSPTRHNLWLNIIFIILIASAVHKLNRKIIVLFIIIIGLGSVTSYSSFFKKRGAKITYDYLKELDLKYQIDYFIDYTIKSKEWFTTSQNISKLFIDKKLSTFKKNHNASDASLVFCLINHRPIDGLKSKDLIRQKMNLKTVLINNNIEKIIKGEEKVLYEKYAFSKTEFGRTRFCSNGTNGVFLKVIKVDIK
jgi:hypothetical protein